MFKVGDKVKLVEKYADLAVGSVGIVHFARASTAGMHNGKWINQVISVDFECGRTRTLFDVRLSHVEHEVTPARSDVMNLVAETADRIFPRRSYDTILKSLMEELGELSTEIAIEQGTKDRAPSTDGVKGEAVDVFVVAVDMLRQAWGNDLFGPEFNAKVAAKLAKWESK